MERHWARKMSGLSCSPDSAWTDFSLLSEFVSLSLSFLTSEMKMDKRYHYFSFWQHLLNKKSGTKHRTSTLEICHIQPTCVLHSSKFPRDPDGSSISSEQKLIYDLIQGPWKSQRSKLLFPWTYFNPVNLDEIRHKQAPHRNPSEAEMLIFTSAGPSW